jgi:hypothetical protein
MSSVPSQEFLRHTLATLAYRAGKALRGAPPAFAAFKADETSRTPVEIVAHMSVLLDWSLHLANGEHVWNEAVPLPWDEEVARFFAALRRFDDHLAAAETLGCPAEKLFQGPIADALTHVGQIAMLRRLSGSPCRGENYFKADIAAGRVGIEQAAPRREFD